jgi:hypothetical protein
MLHAEGRIYGQDDARPRFTTEPTSIPSLPDWPGKGENQKQESKATQNEKEKVPQAQLTGTHPHVPVEELHSRPIGPLDLVAVE